MLFKMAFNNIKKSIKDYSIYFLTLLFAVCMFYTFNSIDAQSSMMSLSDSKYQIIHSLVCMIEYVSVFVSIILGFLIVTSNNFLIKRRKKEIGLYFTLGMSRSRVSLIIVLETLLIGLISLVIGLLCGILLSQVISIFTARMFEVDLTGFKFIFSISAFKKTLLYFGIIFFLVMIFNIFTLNRYKLINLLNASKKSEKVKIKNKYAIILTFLASIGLIGYAYYLLFDNVLMNMDNMALVMLVSGALGTFLLFLSLSSFLLKVVRRIKGLYYKNLNIFTLRQINSKVNTTVFSTTVICLMLLLTIGILSSSISLANAFNNDFNSNNLTDYTVMFMKDYAIVKDDHSIVDKKIDTEIELPSLDKYSDSYVFLHKKVDNDLTIKDMLTDKSIKNLIDEYGDQLDFNYNVPIISYSEYRDLMNVQGSKIYSIKDDQYLLLSNVDFISDSYSDYYSNVGVITVGGIELKSATSKIIDVAIENYNTAGNDGVVVVPDNVASKLDVVYISLIGNFVDTDDLISLEDDFYYYLSSNNGVDMGFDYRTRTMMKNNNVGTTAITTFVGLYLGITFAISSATVLAISQLSNSSDNKERYRVLRQIGADTHMINKALFYQIAFAFLLPLIVALVHSYVGLKEINSLIIIFGDIDLTSNIILTTLFMLVIYGGYFGLTYWSSKNIIKEN